MPSTSIPLEDCLQPESMQKGCSTNKESRYDEGKQIDVSSEEFKPIIASGAMDVVVADKMSSNGLVEPKVLYLCHFLYSLFIKVYLCNF